MSKPHTPGPYIAPSTPTQLPFTRVLDLDPGSPAEDKHLVQVYGCDGTYSMWLLGFWRKTDSLPLKPGDQVLSDWMMASDIHFFKDLPTPEAMAYPTPRSPSLNYKHNPDTLLLEAITYPSFLSGGPENSGECNFIPDLQIWGDGRVVYAPPKGAGGNRQVLTGQLDETRMRQILDLFDRHHFFAPWVWAPMPSTVGGGLELKIHLEAGDYAAGDLVVMDLYRQMLAQIQPERFPVYHPQKAILKVGMIQSYGPPIQSGKPLEWPDQLGFQPEDVGPNGREIDGPGLESIWTQINASPEGDPTLTDAAGVKYIVWLEIPGVTRQINDNHCVSTPVKRYPPGYQQTATKQQESYPAPHAVTPWPTRTFWPGYPAPPPTPTSVPTDTPKPYP